MAGACTEGLDTGFVALGYAKVAFLGVVQGITELLPISSTAHMRIVPALLGWHDPGSAFSGGDAGRGACRRRELFLDATCAAFSSAPSPPSAARFSRLEFPLRLWIVLATMPIVVAGILLSPVLNACNSPLRALSVIGIACIVMAALLGARRNLLAP